MIHAIFKKFRLICQYLITILHICICTCTYYNVIENLRTKQLKEKKCSQSQKTWTWWELRRPR